MTVVNAINFLRLAARKLKPKKKTKFKTSPQYWEARYQNLGTSGAGSYGRLAKFKAKTINDFVEENNIESIIEFGCGDGNQLRLLRVKKYIGVDVSETIIEECKRLFSKDKRKEFILLSDYLKEKADLAISLDVIYHLIEDEVFHDYMDKLFNAADRFVIIYSSNEDEVHSGAQHVRHRKFSDWIENNAPEFELIEKIPNKYPFDATNQKNTSFADFYIFARKNT